MSEYIDRQALDGVFANLIPYAIANEIDAAYVQGLCAAHNTLLTFPTADVAPVVHGHNLSPLSLFDCSICRWSCGDTCHGDTETYNFCPNCGAKMDVLYRK